MITANVARCYLHYNKRTGAIKWRVSPNKHLPKMKGKIAGTLHNGYIRIKLKGRLLFAHRLAYLLVEGYWPAHHLDHRNRKRADNRWCNLRIANSSQNTHNGAVRSDSKVGFRGVSKPPRCLRWRAFITVKGQKIYLGWFNSPKLAHNAYKCAAKKYYGAHGYG